ncbi:MAG: hypothetical protein PHE79_00770 [Eubacteriales bacterium]|nr:hypothetical protein [Eubacteriales bacterium]
MEDGKHPAMKKIKLLIAILDRGKGEEAAAILRESGVTFNIIANANCASGSDIISFLGLSSQERDMVLSVVTEDKVPNVMQKLLYKLDLDESGNGMVFTIPIAGVSGPRALRYMSGSFE